MAERKDIMLAYAWEEKRFNKWPKPVIVQPKLNGDRCRAVFDENGKVTLYSSSGAVRVSVPHLNEELEDLHLSNTELDGELYCHGMRFQDIRSITSRTINLHPNHELINYYIYDLVDEEREQIRRMDELFILIPPTAFFLRRVPMTLVNTPEEFLNQVGSSVILGYEGAIARHPHAPYVRRKTTTMMKLKPQVSDTFVVVGYEEEVSISGAPKGALGALRCWNENKDVFKVGTGFTRSQREVFWELRKSLPGKFVKIRFQELTRDGIPYAPVFEEFVELKEVLDV